ncbi:MAG: TSUP family transporter [Bacteroidota bacterium]
MSVNLPVWWYPLFFVTGLVAGWVDSIAGGGGLITIPVLLSTGMPPQAALGTNKFQASFGSFTAAYHYADKGVVPLGDVIPGIVFTFIGSAIGTFAVQQVHPEALGWIIPFLLLAIALYMLFTPAAGLHEDRPRFARGWFYLVLGLTLGFYDGFFGPGVGSFWAIAFVSLMGFNFLRATGYTKVMNFTSNIISFVVFLIGGNVYFAPAISMAAGQILGARIGAGMVVRRGVRLIRPIFVTIVILTTLKLLYNRISP